jgi:hypothetical protein
MEDVDISIRMRNKGWKLYYVPKGIVYHRFHGSSDEAFAKFYCERNRLLLIAKHYPQKLGDALMGSGYFTVLNRKNELFKILPVVLEKLIRTHTRDVISSSILPLLQNLERVLNLEKDYLIKKVDELLSKKKTLEMKLDGLKGELERTRVLMHEREAMVERLREEKERQMAMLLKKEKELEELKRKVFQLQEEIKGKEAMLEEKGKALEER